MTDEIDDGLSGLAHVLAIRRSGYHRHVNTRTGAVVIFPEMAKNEHEWERRALEMHSAQLVITLAAKPQENTFADRIARGD